jgi:YegS/Rv2252/BmrU family lipid kinase
MPRKIIYLINPISGNRKKTTLRDIITRKTKERQISFEILQTSKTGNYDLLKEKIRKEKISDIVICGGDGTVSSIAASLKDTPINIGIIPMGSGNGLALAAGIPVSPRKALEIIFAGNATPIDGLYINNRFSCMLCGIGFDAQVAHDFAKQRRRGLQTYIKVSAINFFKAHAHPFIIESKETTITTEAFFISIANSNQFGNNVTIAPKASLNDGLLDIVIAKKMSKLMLPFSLMGQLSGINAVQHLSDHINKKNIIYFQTSELSIHNPSLAPLHIDGDPVETSEKFVIKVVKNAFRLLH